ncbi:MAG: hypothetical protein LBL90_01250, partial [Prevotellaceae bacterium]|nr:hypothetical protein [Prevotellaceae bacterium]
MKNIAYEIDSFKVCLEDQSYWPINHISLILSVKLKRFEEIKMSLYLPAIITSIKPCHMPQAILPLFAEDMIIVSFHVGVQKRNGIVYYFQGGFPFYRHMEDDRQSFKHVVCQLLVNGMATRSEISRAFGYPSAVSVVGRSSSRKTERAIFFQSHRPFTQPRIFTPEVVTRITELHLS